MGVVILLLPEIDHKSTEITKVIGSPLSGTSQRLRRWAWFLTAVARKFICI